MPIGTGRWKGKARRRVSKWGEGWVGGSVVVRWNLQSWKERWASRASFSGRERGAWVRKFRIFIYCILWCGGKDGDDRKFFSFEGKLKGREREKGE